MGDTPQAGFNTAKHNRHMLIGFSAALAIHQSGPVRTPVADVIWTIGIITTPTPVSGIAVNHRVHIAGGDTKIEIGRTQFSKGVSTVPIGLINDANAKALRL